MQIPIKVGTDWRDYARKILAPGPGVPFHRYRSLKLEENIWLTIRRDELKHKHVGRNKRSTLRAV